MGNYFSILDGTNVFGWNNRRAHYYQYFGRSHFRLCGFLDLTIYWKWGEIDIIKQIRMYILFHLR